MLPNFTSPFSKNDLPSVWQLCNVKTLVINLDDVEPIDLRGMRNLEDLSTVCLYRCRLDKTTIQIIAALPHLKTLYLETCDITGDAWSAFDQLSDLTELHLNGNSVTDERLAAIGRCDRLNSLSLLGTKVTASGLRALERFASLQEVVVSPTTNSSSATHGVSEQELQELDPGRIKFKRIVSVQIDD